MTESMSFLGDKPVHRIGFGAMQLAGPGVFGPPKDRDGALAVLRRAVELGVDHIDTAQFYGPDVVNELIREALHPYPGDLRLVTKVGAVRDSDGGWIRAAEPDELKHQVRENLKALDVDRIDLVNLRRFERSEPDAREPDLADQLGALAELREAGDIDLIGVSNVTAETVRKAIDTVGIGGVQNPFGILDRSDEPVLELCREHGVSYVPFFPLGSAFGGGGPKALAVDPHVSTVAAKHGVTPSQVALAWALAQYDGLLLIPGTSSVAHLEENMAVIDIELEAEDLETLDRVRSKPVEGH
ncbi:Predicted oxidoreductase [Actinopolymorpha cephalotaxi]|uniref:Predicted oxidoreductase n=1 Tax=Actinopolymorpha cephalotaxi TaxID=504797 RepID=A0A1I3BDL9_9ACTN|nr:oxidoreductase [Actinopolymorpha cephalotaxi]NYH86757.1 aryl-alcohol dehydrogenase-like predicted oxidoreductase [Actinopolymorpha cephalotaxi]SFH60039.1 Predicted oxidoreductase [Actinopolymorpha cephalotaxi]